MAPIHNSGYSRRTPKAPTPVRRFSRNNKHAAKRIFEGRSFRSRAQDLIRMAPIAPNLEVYMKCPDRFDFPGVDTPDPKLVFSHKTKREQAADLSKAAKKAPIEVWVQDTNRHDLPGVDTPKDKPTRKFRVLKKDEAQEESKKESEKEQKADKTEKTHKLPSKKEILQLAKEMFHETQQRMGLEPTTPEEGELKETGFFERARVELMRGIDTVANVQVLQYVDELKAELEPMGFTITPI